MPALINTFELADLDRNRGRNPVAPDLLHRGAPGRARLGVLDFLATRPLAIPGIVLGVGLFLAYTRPPLTLYGTIWILLIAFVTIELPAAYQQFRSAFHAVHPELEEAGRHVGRHAAAHPVGHHRTAAACVRRRHLVLHLRRVIRELSAA